MVFSLFEVAQPSPQLILEHFITLRRNPIPFSGHPLFVCLQYQRPPAMQETQDGPLGWKDPLEKEMATYSSILAWEIPRTEEPGRLQSSGSRESDTTE